MLVLSRRVGESVIIEGPSEIIIVAAGHNRARIGIKSDRSVNIRRAELPKRQGESDDTSRTIASGDTDEGRAATSPGR